MAFTSGLSKSQLTHSHTGLARNNGTKQTSTRDKRAQAQGDDDVVELVEDDESECDLSDYLTVTSQWSDMEEQGEWWHLLPSQIVPNSPTPSSLTTVTPLPAGQLSRIRGATEVDPGKESEGEGEEGVNVMGRMQGGKHQTPCSSNHYGE